MDTAITPVANLQVTIGQIANHHADQSLFKSYQDRLDPNTLLRHKYDLACYKLYLDDVYPEATGWPASVEDLMSNPATWVNMTHGLIEGFVQWMLRDGYAMGTINMRLYTIRAYFTLAAKAGFADEFEVMKVAKGFSYSEGDNMDQKRAVTRKPGSKKSVPIALSRDQIQLLLTSLPNTPQGWRDKLLMCLLLEHGLRCGEVADIVPENVNLTNGLLVFKREKVKKTQKHKLTADTVVALVNYFKCHTPEDKLLAGSLKDRDGLKLIGNMGRRAITKRVQYLGQKILGIPHLSAHDCRHTWVESAIRGETNIKALQTAGGWSSPAMPLRYATDAEIANEGVVLK